MEYKTIWFNNKGITMTQSIHQDISVNASPQQIFDLLTSSEQFTAMCQGAAADIDPAEGGAFSCFGGMIIGRNIECHSGEQLVQAWRAQNWAPGIYSIVSFKLQAADGGTQISFDHTGYPEGQGEHLADGWHQNYWTPMQQHFV
jgi:activator of HSP90 ATPase